MTAGSVPERLQTDVRKVHTGHPIYKNENKKGKIKKERNLP